MALSLAELSKIETDILRKSVMDKMLMESDVMQICPWETIGQLSTGIVRYQDLPSVGFRKVNEAWAESTGTLEQRVEHISLMGGYIDTDKAIARAKNTIGDARAIQQDMKVKAMTYKFNETFINGDPEVDPEEFKGLLKRVDAIYAEGYTGQLIDVGLGANRGFLYDTTARHTMLDKLDELIYAIRGHKPDYLFMNSKCLLALRSLLRREKLLDNTRDMFDRVVDIYQGVRLVDIGCDADQTTEIITNAETKGGGTEETSIYAVRFGAGEYLWGICEYPLEVTDLGEVQTAPVFRTEVDFPLGLAMADPYAIGRLYGAVPDSDAS